LKADKTRTTGKPPSGDGKPLKRRRINSGKQQKKETEKGSMAAEKKVEPRAQRF